MSQHMDRIKYFMSEERRLQQNPTTILNETIITKGMTIADLGSGPGFFTIPIAEMTGEKGLVYAVDNNKAMLEALVENISKSKVNPNIIKIVKSDVSKTGIPKDSVDIVLFANVLHELADKKTFFQEVKRICKHTARIVDVDWKKTKTEHGPPLKDRLSEDEAIRLLGENGFSVVKQIDLGPTYYELIAKPKTNH